MSDTSQTTQAPGVQALPPATVTTVTTPVPPAAPATPPAAPPAAPGTPPVATPPGTVAAAPVPAVALPTEKPPVTPNASTAEEFSYDPTGDAGLDYALNFVGKLGYGDAHPAIIAAQQGDFTLIKAELATKGVAGSDAVIALAEQAHARASEKHKASEAELAQVAATAAGSAENWTLVREWAASNADTAEKAQVNAALAQGGFIAKAVIDGLVGLYRSKHTLPKEAEPVATAGAAASSAAASPMTAQAYAKAVQELTAKYGARTEDTAEYAAIQAQRLAARRAGY